MRSERRHAERVTGHARPPRHRRTGGGGHVAERPLRPGEAFRIFTGGPLPDGADSVIPQEDVSLEGTTLIVPRAVTIGDYVRPRGEDVRAGTASSSAAGSSAPPRSVFSPLSAGRRCG